LGLLKNLAIVYCVAGIFFFFSADPLKEEKNMRGEIKRCRLECKQIDGLALKIRTTEESGKTVEPTRVREG